jgi:hypothetical protein
MNKLIFTLGTSFLLSGMTSTAFAQEIKLKSLCEKFPLNSRCQSFDSSKTESNKIQLKTRQLDRELFCDKFPMNSKCKGEPLESIKFKLDRSGEDNEWIYIERKDNLVKVLHTSQVKDGLVSGILNGALGFVPTSFVPLPSINKYNWEEHQIIKVSFKSDLCQADSCMITGKEYLDIPKETNIYQGSFIIHYQEEDLVRAITFKIPSDIKPEISNTVIISTPVQ